jgi:hypothetical protein
VVALVSISKSKNLEKDRFDLVPGVMAWMRRLASWVARSICVASPLCCIFTLWLERTGEAIFSLMPPKAITSSILLDLEVGVEGEKGAAAIHGAPLPGSAPFLRPAGKVSEDFELMHPPSRVIGERGAVSFAALRGEVGVFCPCRIVPEFSEEARKDLAPSALGSEVSATAGVDGLGDAAEKTAPAVHMAKGEACASTAAGSAAAA